jgi:hypothetical protein
VKKAILLAAGICALCLTGGCSWFDTGISVDGVINVTAARNYSDIIVNQYPSGEDVAGAEVRIN